MKAFVSYSFKDSELHVITLLFEQLRKSGYIVETSFDGIPYENDTNILNSDVFIGIITNDSSSIDYVMYEWGIANNNNVNNILIIEDGVNVEDSESISFIRFNRKDQRLQLINCLI